MGKASLARTSIEEVMETEKYVSLFSQSMNERLSEKVERGWRGWDDPKKRADFEGEAGYALALATKFRATGKMRMKKLIDAANFCMFLWRIERANQESRAKRKSKEGRQ